MKKELLTEGRLIDYFIIYHLAKKFITPFKKWEAYRLGIIDEKGKRTKKKVESTEEKNAYTLLDRMIRKIRVFVGDRWFLKLTLAYLLLKEDYEFPKYKRLLNEDIDNRITRDVQVGVLERVVLSYENLSNSVLFSITSLLKNPETSEEVVTSKFSVTIEKFDEKDEKFLGFLNSVFGNLLTGGFKEYKIYESQKGILDSVKISYGPSELKIETETNQVEGKFYAVFNNRTEAKNFINAWDELYKEVIYK